MCVRSGVTTTESSHACSQLPEGVCVSVCVPWLVYETREIEHKLSDKQMYEAALVVAHVCPLTAIIAFLPLKKKQKTKKTNDVRVRVCK